MKGERHDQLFMQYLFHFAFDFTYFTNVKLFIEDKDAVSINDCLNICQFMWMMLIKTKKHFYFYESASEITFIFNFIF